MTPAQLKIRMSDELRRKVEAAAKASGNSLNTELVNRLERSFVTGLRLARGDREARVAVFDGKLLLLFGDSPEFPVELHMDPAEFHEVLSFFEIEDKT